MSLVVGGSISTLLLGGLAALSSELRAVSIKVVTEPSVLELMAELGSPYVIPMTYDDIIMDRISCLSMLMKGGRASTYVGQRLITCVKPTTTMIKLREALMRDGLSFDEAAALALAKGTHGDLVLLRRSQARVISESYGLRATSPLMAVTEALRRGVIGLREFEKLSFLLKGDKHE